PVAREVEVAALRVEVPYDEPLRIARVDRADEERAVGAEASPRHPRIAGVALARHGEARAAAVRAQDPSADRRVGLPADVDSRWPRSGDLDRHEVRVVEPREALEAAGGRAAPYEAPLRRCTGDRPDGLAPRIRGEVLDGVTVELGALLH